MLTERLGADPLPTVPALAAELDAPAPRRAGVDDAKVPMAAVSADRTRAPMSPGADCAAPSRSKQALKYGVEVVRGLRYQRDLPVERKPKELIGAHILPHMQFSPPPLVPQQPFHRGLQHHGKGIARTCIKRVRLDQKWLIGAHDVLSFIGALRVVIPRASASDENALRLGGHFHDIAETVHSGPAKPSGQMIPGVQHRHGKPVRLVEDGGMPHPGRGPTADVEPQATPRGGRPRASSSGTSPPRRCTAPTGRPRRRCLGPRSSGGASRTLKASFPRTSPRLVLATRAPKKKPTEPLCTVQWAWSSRRRPRAGRPCSSGQYLPVRHLIYTTRERQHARGSSESMGKTLIYTQGRLVAHRCSSGNRDRGAPMAWAQPCPETTNGRRTDLA